MISLPKISTVRLQGFKGMIARAVAVFVAALAPVTFGILTVILGLIGWSRQLFDGTIHSVSAVVLRSLGDFALSPKNFEEGNALTEISSVCGILTLYSSFAVIIASVFREQRRKFLARHVLRKHHLVIGNTMLAKRVCAIWGRTDGRTLRVAPPTAPTPEFLQTVVRHTYDERLAGVFAMHRARRIFFDLGDDAMTIALALKALAVLAVGRPRRRPSSSPREWICVVQDDRFADYFQSEVQSLRSKLDHGVDIPQIVILQPENLIADQLLTESGFGWRDDRLPSHSLVVGYDLLGKHLVEGLLQRARREQANAIVTVLSNEHERHSKMFAKRRPSIDGLSDVLFLDPDALECLLRPEASALRDRDAAFPITAVFLTSDRLRDNILSYIFIQAIRAKLGRLKCKVFSRRGDGDNIDSLLPTSSVVSATTSFATFGLSDEWLGGYLDMPERTAFGDVSTKPIDFVGAERP